MTWYSVRIETRGHEPYGMTEDEFGDRLGDLVGAFVSHSGFVVGAGHLARWGASISIESTTALTAIAEASTIIRRHASDIFLPDWPIVRAEAVREDVLDEELTQSMH